MFGWRGSILAALAARRVRSQKALQDYEHELKQPKNLFGEAQGEQLAEAAFPRPTLQLSAAGLLWAKMWLFIYSRRGFIFWRASAPLGKTILVLNAGLAGTIIHRALVWSCKYVSNAHGLKIKADAPPPSQAVVQAEGKYEHKAASLPLYDPHCTVDSDVYYEILWFKWLW